MWSKSLSAQWFAQTLPTLVLHPRGALRFCDGTRRKHGWFDLPDDVLLRWLMNRRKNP
jgi:hypothetical protein